MNFIKVFVPTCVCALVSEVFFRVDRVPLGVELRAVVRGDWESVPLVPVEEASHASLAGRLLDLARAERRGRSMAMSAGLGWEWCQ